MGHLDLLKQLFMHGSNIPSGISQDMCSQTSNIFAPPTKLREVQEDDSPTSDCDMAICLEKTHVVQQAVLKVLTYSVPYH